MGQMIAYCGLDCDKCEAYTVTQSDDVPAQERLLARSRAQFNAPDLEMSSVLCDGCSSTGRHGGFCRVCQVRACASGRNLANCAACPDYLCATLEGFLSMAPRARATLEELRSN
jgi:hypothetical protein